MTWTDELRYQLSPSVDVVRVPGVGRLHDEHGCGAESARTEDERRVVGVRAPGQARDVVAAGQSEPRGTCTSQRPLRRRAAHLLRCRDRLAERVPVPAGCGGRAGSPGGAGLENLERGAIRVTAADGEHGGLAGRIAASLEACEQRRGAGSARAEHDSEDDCDGGGDRDAGGEAGNGRPLPPDAGQARDPAFPEAVRLDVHGATVDCGANRALTAG